MIIKNTITPEINSIINALESSGIRQVLTDAGHEFIRETKSNFGSSGEYRIEPWAPLNKDYAKKVGSSTATDERSSKLINSITLGPLRETYITIFTRCSYAIPICFGSLKKNLPARNFWPVKFLGNNPSTSQFLPKAERDMFNVIIRRFILVSRNVLPKLTSPTKRMGVIHGNVLTGVF